MRTQIASYGQEFAQPNLSASQAGPVHAPLLHAAWLFAVGISATNLHWIQPSFVLLGIALAISICMLAAFRAPRVVWLPLVVLWVLLGAWCATMEPRPAAAPALAHLSDQLLRSVEGTVVDAGSVRAETGPDLDEPDAEDPGEQPTQRIDLKLSTIEVVTDAMDAQVETAGAVRLTVRWPPAGSSAQHKTEGFHCGDRLRAFVRLLEPETYHDPGTWNREEFLLDQGITSTATVSFDKVERLNPSPSSPSLRELFTCRLNNWQHASTARILALPDAMRAFPAPLRLSQGDAAMLSAMVAGDRTYLTRSLRVGFERTGSFHLLVVSGFHLAIVAAGVLWLARRMHLPRLPATLLTMAASSVYALFTGFATPVQRSLWMVAVYLLARLIYRDRNPLNTIGFAALCLLALSPRSLFDTSFQMTLLAVVAIAGIASPLLQNSIHPYLQCTRDLRLIAIDQKFTPFQAQFRVTLRLLASTCEATRHEQLAWRVVTLGARSVLRVAELFVVSCVVELAMTLPMALYFHRITLFALPVNLFILPLLALLMPAALVTLLTLFAWKSAAVIAAIPVAILLHFGQWLVRYFGSMRWGDFRVPGPLLVSSLGFCALIGAAMVLARGSRRHRRCAWLALLLAAFAAVVPRPTEHSKTALLMEAIDVGQGDSLLLITPDGKSLLVDGGGFGGGLHQAHQDFDIGEEVVSEALWARGIRRLDAVALTHAHSDHMGGLPAVLRNFHPKELWVGKNPHVAAYNDLLDEAANLAIRVRSFRAGDSFSLGDAQIAVLAPLKDYLPGTEPANNDSLVMHVTYRATSVLLEGDAEAPIEHAMLAEPGLRSTLLKVGHHGSNTSTRPEFLSGVAPQWAVISCGLHNRYGHPRPEVLASLESAGVKTFSTDLNGAVCFDLDGTSVSADPRCGWQSGP